MFVYGSSKRMGALGFAALAVAGALLALALGMSAPESAYAAEPGVYTANATSSYANPDTGQIEDAGGESQEALGTSMVEGIAQPNALVQVDADGNTFVTVRFGQASELGDVAVSADESGSGSFGEETVATMTGEDASANTADYEFAVPSESATLRFNMYVEPMGRAVTFFMTLDGLTEGNAAGFAETVEVSASEQASSASAASADAASAQSAPAAAPASSTAAASSGAAASEAAPAADSGKTDSGVKEYNGDGAEVKGADAAASGADSLNYPLIVGGAAVVIVLVVLVAYFAVIRPKQKKQDEAAKVASSKFDSR